MSRMLPWQSKCPSVILERIEKAQSLRFYLIAAIGPTAFLLREDDDDNGPKLRVSVGSLHSCSCNKSTNVDSSTSLCVHILWLMLRKLRLPANNPLVWQPSWVEREIEQVLWGSYAKQQHTYESNMKRNIEGQDNDCVNDSIIRRDIGEEDVCPICQEEMQDGSDPVTFCRRGCGNNVHVKCMKVWAEHQHSTGDITIKCPLCREEFGAIHDIRTEYHRIKMKPIGSFRQLSDNNNVHINIECTTCSMSPVQGPCYRCVSCSRLHLCHACFCRGLHPNHSFLVRHTTIGRWRKATRGSSQLLPDTIVSDMQGRELTEADYEALQALDTAAGATAVASTISKRAALRLPSERLGEGSPLLVGGQCRICLKPYLMKELVRRLPCRCRFHSRCIVEWVTKQRSTCPVDGKPLSINLKNIEDSNKFEAQEHPVERIPSPNLFIGTVRGNVGNHISKKSSNNLSPLHGRNVVNTNLLRQGFIKNRKGKSLRSSQEALPGLFGKALSQNNSLSELSLSLLTPSRKRVRSVPSISTHSSHAPADGDSSSNAVIFSAVNERGLHMTSTSSYCTVADNVPSDLILPSIDAQIELPPVPAKNSNYDLFIGNQYSNSDNMKSPSRNRSHGLHSTVWRKTYMARLKNRGSIRSTLSKHDRDMCTISIESLSINNNNNNNNSEAPRY